MSGKPATPSPLYAAEARVHAERVTDLLGVIRRAQAELGTELAEITNTGANSRYGYLHTAEWLAEIGNLGEAEAGHMITRATALNPGRNLDGSPTPALAPLTAAAAADGTLSATNIEHEFNEQQLVELAQVAGPTQVRQLGRTIVAAADPDGPSRMTPSRWSRSATSPAVTSATAATG